MTPLREKYQRDMTVRGLAQRTQQSYTSYVADLACYYHRSPDLISYDEVVDWIHYLIRERELAASSVNTCLPAGRSPSTASDSSTPSPSIAMSINS